VGLRVAGPHAAHRAAGCRARSVRRRRQDQGQDAKKVRARLSGAEEFPPRDTLARGEFKLRVTQHGTALEFELTGEHTFNVVASTGPLAG
jgi:hypothetical protein